MVEGSRLLRFKIRSVEIVKSELRKLLYEHGSFSKTPG